MAAKWWVDFPAFRKFRVQNPSSTLLFPIQDLRNFPRHLQASTGIVPEDRPWSFPPNALLTNHPVTSTNVSEFCPRQPMLVVGEWRQELLDLKWDYYCYHHHHHHHHHHPVTRLYIRKAKSLYWTESSVLLCPSEFNILFQIPQRWRQNVPPKRR
jgi:hypothetical protein